MAKPILAVGRGHRAPSDGKRRKSTFCRSAVPKAKWDEMLGQFSDVLGDAETAHFALQSMEEDLGGRVGPAISTLGRSVKALKRVYSLFDRAIMSLVALLPRGRNLERRQKLPIPRSKQLARLRLINWNPP